MAREFTQYLYLSIQTGGSRRVTAQLRRAPYEFSVPGGPDRQINRKRVRRLMDEMGLKRPVRRVQRRTTQSQHFHPRYPNLVIGLSVSYPDQVWVSDITYVRLSREFVYLAVIMDVFTRSTCLALLCRQVRGWHLHRWLDQELTLTALPVYLSADEAGRQVRQQALLRGTPSIHHSDQGVQPVSPPGRYAARAYTELLHDRQVQISMAEVGEAWQNGHAERLIRTIKVVP